MSEIPIERPDAKGLEALGVKGWPTWEKGPSTFDWTHDETETCYVIEGEVTIRTSRGEVTIGEGDLARFPAGLSCTWHVERAIEKHYSFGD